MLMRWFWFRISFSEMSISAVDCRKRLFVLLLCIECKDQPIFIFVFSTNIVKFWWFWPFSFVFCVYVYFSFLVKNISKKSENRSENMWMPLIRVETAYEFKASGPTIIIAGCVIYALILTVACLGCNLSDATVLYNWFTPRLRSPCFNFYHLHSSHVVNVCDGRSTRYCHKICVIASKCELATSSCKMTTCFALQPVVSVKQYLLLC